MGDANTKEEGPKRVWNIELQLAEGVQGPHTFHEAFNWAGDTQSSCFWVIDANDVRHVWGPGEVRKATIVPVPVND